MRVGGNDKCNEFLKKYGIEKTTSIDKKYNNPVAMFYRNIISAEAEGKEPPIPPENLGNVNDTSTDDYIQKELKAREEARERLRQKFGGSAGLSSSGGVMQGIGSDSSYRPGVTNPQSTFVLPVDVDKLTDASKTAFSFLSSSLSTLGDSVMKTATALIDESSTAQSSEYQFPRPPTNQGAMTNPNDEWANTWASLSTTAASIWKSAADATVDIVNNLQQDPNIANPSETPVSRMPQEGDGFEESTTTPTGKKLMSNQSSKSTGSSDDFFATFGV